MIELSNTNAQVLAAGQSAVFNSVILHTGCAECHRNNTGAINLTQKNAIYEVSFNCNIGATTAGDTAEIGITLDGSPLQETNSKVVTAAVGDLQNVSAETFINTCCCGGSNTVSLTNLGTTEITIDEYPRISVKRKA